MTLIVGLFFGILCLAVIAPLTQYLIDNHPRLAVAEGITLLSIVITLLWWL